LRRGQGEGRTLYWLGSAFPVVDNFTSGELHTDARSPFEQAVVAKSPSQHDQDRGGKTRRMKNQMNPEIPPARQNIRNIFDGSSMGCTNRNPEMDTAITAPAVIFRLV
jgi:hypothetical protein